MSSCTFFGHRDAPKEIGSILRSTLIDLIENQKADMFYVGTQGNFDCMVEKNLKRLKAEYPHIRYVVVLAYIPSPQSALARNDYNAGHPQYRKRAT